MVIMTKTKQLLGLTLLIALVAMPAGAVCCYTTGELATSATNQNLFPAVAPLPATGEFVAAYHLGDSVFVEQWDGSAWNALTDFHVTALGFNVLGDGLSIAADPAGNLHIALIPMSGDFPNAQRVVYYGFYNTTLALPVWTFNLIEGYSDPQGHINPRNLQVQWNPVAGAPALQWTVADASPASGPAPHHSLEYATQNPISKLWSVPATTDSVSGPFTSIDDAAFAIASDGVAHSTYVLRSGTDLPKLMYGHNGTGTFVFGSIVDGDGAKLPGKANAIALSAADKVHIAWYDYLNDALHHITNESGSFVDETVDSQAATDLGRRCSIDLNASGDMLIAYQDHTNGLLKTACSKAGGPWAINTVADTIQNARFVGAALQDSGEAMVVHDAKVAENDKKVLYAFEGLVPATIDVTSDVNITMGRMMSNRRTGEVSGTMTVTNPVGSGKTFTPPFTVVISNITVGTVTVANADGTTLGSDPFFDLSEEIGCPGLAPGDSVAFSVVFGNASRARFNYDTTAFAGELP
jgi:hypothetical protein